MAIGDVARQRGVGNLGRASESSSVWLSPSLAAQSGCMRLDAREQAVAA